MSGLCAIIETSLLTAVGDVENRIHLLSLSYRRLPYRIYMTSLIIRTSKHICPSCLLAIFFLFKVFEPPVKNPFRDFRRHLTRCFSWSLFYNNFSVKLWKLYFFTTFPRNLICKQFKIISEINTQKECERIETRENRESIHFTIWIKIQKRKLSVWYSRRWKKEEKRIYIKQYVFKSLLSNMKLNNTCMTFTRHHLLSTDIGKDNR